MKKIKKSMGMYSQNRPMMIERGMGAGRGRVLGRGPRGGRGGGRGGGGRRRWW